MIRPTRRLVAAAATGAVLVLSGCGGSSSGGSGGGSVPSDPKGELVASVDNLSGASVVTSTLQLDTSGADLQKLVESTGSTLTSEDADAIAAAQLVFETKDKAFSLRAVDKGKNLIELRVVDGSLYLQADVPGILDAFHQSDQLGALQSQAENLPTFIQAIVSGQWVSLDKSALQSLAAQMGGGSASPEATASASAAAAQILAALKNTLNTDVTVTKVGSDSNGDHLRATGNIQTLAADLQNAIRQSVPGGSALSDQLDASSAPSRDITIDAWVKDGALSKLSLDLAQFDTESKLPSGSTLPLSLTFTQSGDDIGAPSGATPVDLTQLGTLFGGLTGGGAVG